MNLRNTFRGLVFLSFLCILSCQDQEFPVQQYPRVQTSAVTGISGSGMRLQGKVLSAGNRPITDHGFIWSIHRNVDPNASSRISLGALSGARSFEARIEKGLVEDTTYYVKAFTASKAHIVYGNVVSFKTDVVTLPDSNQASPVIDAFSPHRGTFGDMVTISGSNFSAVGLDNHVQFNQYAARVMEASDTSLIVRVPLGLTEKDHTISVTVSDRRAEAAAKFEMLAPVIEAVFPTSGPLGTDVTIQGANFSTDLRANEVVFGNRTARLLSVNKNELRVRIVQGIYDSRNPEIRVKVAGQTVVAETFHVEDAWMEKNTTSYNGMDYGTAFAIGDEGYAGLGAPGAKTIYKYSVTTNAWTEIATFPGAGRDHATSFVLNGKAYVGGGGKDVLRTDFYRYDPALDSWHRIADFPFGISKAVGLTRNGKGYVVAKDPADDVSRLWVYDPAADKWQTVSSNKADGVADAGFVVGDRLFIFAFDPNGGYNQLLEFNFQTSSWVSRGGRVEADRYATAFALNGKGYVVSRGALMEYNLSGNTWRTLAGDHPSARQGAFAFVIGDKVYYGFGHEGPTRLKDFWELDLGGL